VLACGVTPLLEAVRRGSFPEAPKLGLGGADGVPARACLWVRCLRSIGNPKTVVFEGPVACAPSLNASAGLDATPTAPNVLRPLLDAFVTQGPVNSRTAQGERPGRHRETDLRILKRDRVCETRDAKSSLPKAAQVIAA